jgi:hypothetical protein
VLRNMPQTVAPYIAGLSEITGHYITAAYWTDTEPDTEDTPPTLAVMSASGIMAAAASCARFMQRCGPAVLIAYSDAGGTPEQMGHDLWLSRNGHGAGFWDRKNLGVPYGFTSRPHADTLGDYLHRIAKGMGQCDLVQGDDGLLYLEGGE